MFLGNFFPYFILLFLMVVDVDVVVEVEVVVDVEVVVEVEVVSIGTLKINMI